MGASKKPSYTPTKGEKSRCRRSDISTSIAIKLLQDTSHHYVYTRELACLPR